MSIVLFSSVERAIEQRGRFQRKEYKIAPLRGKLYPVPIEGDNVKNRILFAAVVLFLMTAAAAAGAQDSTVTRTKAKHRFEITPYGGYIWTRGYDVQLGGQRGNLDVRASADFGVTVGYAVKDSLAQIELIYSHQDADVFFEFSGQETDYGQVAIDHIHLGGLFGVPSGRSVWFTTFSLGASRWAPDGKDDDARRFSLMFGLGAKYPINDRLGLRFQARIPYMFVADSARYVCNDSGCLSSAGGKSMWQFDLIAGLIIKL
jgi:hypothetical protein